MDITSPCNLPRFSTSAMDGYAISSAEITDPYKDAPIRLKIVGSVAAGDYPKELWQKGCCVEIMTGAAMPAGADTVLRVEQAEIVQGYLVLRNPIQRGTNVRFIGEDIQQRDVVLPKGHTIGAKELHILIMLGLQTVQVFDLCIGIIATGSELVPNDSQIDGALMRCSKVINCNGPFLKAALDSFGRCQEYEAVADDFSRLKASFTAAASECDLIVCTGGVSVGKFDLTCKALEELGEVVFHRVQIKPGAPVLYGKIQAGERSVDFFGLPGTPMATAATYRFLLKPFLRHLFGQPKEKGLYLPASNAVSSTPHTTSFRRGIRGGHHVTILPHRPCLSNVMKANCWVLIPPVMHDMSVSDGEPLFVTFSE